MNIRIFRQPTKDIQPDGHFHIDTLQVQYAYHSLSTKGVTGLPITTYSDWKGVPIIEADSYPIIETMNLKKGNVVFNISLQKKMVMVRDRELAINENFVCEKPHDDEDFSYMCGSEYCRCTQ